MVSTTKVQIIPQLTTVERDALVSPVDGTLIYNTDIGVNQTYNGSTWIDNSAGAISLQTAYDGGSVINMDSNVNLEVFSTTSDLAFSVIENGALSGIQCNRALQIDYPGIGGPILFFQHLTPTAPGNLLLNIGGQTQASNGFSKSYETMQVQVVNDSDAAFEAETIFKNIINNNQIDCFSTGIENRSFRDLNMQNNPITNAGFINASQLNTSSIDLQAGNLFNAASIESQALVSTQFSFLNSIEQTNPLTGGTLQYFINNTQTASNGNISWEMQHNALNDAPNGFVYLKEEHVTQNVAAGNETAEQKFYCAESGALQEYMRFAGNVSQVNIYKTLDMNDNEIVDCNNIRTNIQPIFTINKNGSNATDIYGNSTIRRMQISNRVYMLSGTDLDMGTGNIINSTNTNQIDMDNANDIVLQSGIGNVRIDSNLDMNNNDILNTNNLNVNSINGLSAVGGLSSGTSNSAVLTASTAEQSILSNTFVGSRTAPANTFQQGDAFTAILAGNFSSNNGDTLTIRLKGGATGTTILSTIVIPLNNSTNEYFELEIDFVIRQIGVATVAELAVNYDFSYNQASGGNFQGQRLCELNNTTFDTTISNALDVTAQFSSTSGSNNIETLLSTLGKTY